MGHDGTKLFPLNFHELCGVWRGQLRFGGTSLLKSRNQSATESLSSPDDGASERSSWPHFEVLLLTRAVPFPNEPTGNGNVLNSVE